MIKELNLRGRKSAGVTLELILAITLAVLVLFFILNIFSDNLKGMVANSGIQNMFNNKQKATYAKEAFDPTQVNVQVLAEQGSIVFHTLQEAQDYAINKIKGYINNPPQNADQVMDLAKALTIAKTTVDYTTLSKQGINVSDIAHPYQITIDNSTRYLTKVGTATIIPSNTAGSNSVVTQLPINQQFTYGAGLTSSKLYDPDVQLSTANQIISAKYQ